MWYACGYVVSPPERITPPPRHHAVGGLTVVAKWSSEQNKQTVQLMWGSHVLASMDVDSGSHACAGSGVSMHVTEHGVCTIADGMNEDSTVLCVPIAYMPRFVTTVAVPIIAALGTHTLKCVCRTYPICSAGSAFPRCVRTVHVDWKLYHWNLPVEIRLSTEEFPGATRLRLRHYCQVSMYIVGDWKHVTVQENSHFAGIDCDWVVFVDCPSLYSLEAWNASVLRSKCCLSRLTIQSIRALRAKCNVNSFLKAATSLAHLHLPSPALPNVLPATLTRLHVDMKPGARRALYKQVSEHPRLHTLVLDTSFMDLTYINELRTLRCRRVRLYDGRTPDRTSQAERACMCNRRYGHSSPNSNSSALTYMVIQRTA